MLDNSADSHESEAHELSQGGDVRYHHFPDNRGIAWPLNYVLQALGQMDGWVLTLDQDSFFAPGVLACYIKTAESFLATDENVALFAPDWGGGALQPQGDGNSIEYVSKAITSGSLVCLEAARSVGGYNEELFIDEVDYDLCYRLRRHGYHIARINTVVLEHHVGKTERHHLLWMHPVVYHHPALRKYYITRNRIYIQRHYPELFWESLRLNVRMFFLVLLFEDDKLSKVLMMLRGLWDGLRGRMGKLNEAGH
ncbi:MAG: glycosyltransferase [Selenomonas sp.]|nr:glycosyltransferase [Selenomonas sp.]